MIEVVAIEQGGTQQTSLDVNDQPIELNVQYWDAQEPLSSRAPYSLRFEMPFSDTNDRFFSHFYNVNSSDGTFSAAVKTDVQVYVDGLLIFRGVLQLHQCDVGARTYSVSVLEELGKLFDVIKGMTWEQLFTNDDGSVDIGLDHVLTWDNIKDSWDVTNDITDGLEGAGTIVYPLSDWGQGVAQNEQEAQTGYGFFYTNYIDSNGNEQTGGIDDDYLRARNFKPAIRVKYVLDYIFDKVGFRVESEFLDSADFSKLYCFLATETFRVTGRPQYPTFVGIPTSLYGDQGTSIWQQLPLTVESPAPYFDPDNQFVGGEFTAPYDGVYTFRVQLAAVSLGGPPGNGYTIETNVQKNGAWMTVFGQSTLFVQSVTSALEHDWTLELQQGDEVSFWWRSSNFLATVEVLVSHQFQVDYPVFYTGVKLTEVDSSGSFVDVSQCFPNVKVDKWLRAIVERFNLAMYTTLSEPTTLYIEPWSDWMSADSATYRDWTNVIDTDSVSIRPTTEYQKKTYLFSDGEGKDFLNRYWQENLQWVKGKYEYISENDFAGPPTSTLDVFQPLRLRKLFTTYTPASTTIVPNVLLPCFWDWADGSDGSIYLKRFAKAKPVLAYYNGLQPIGNGRTFEFDSEEYSTYPYFSIYNTVGVDEDTKVLNWGYDFPDNFDAPFVDGLTQNYSFYTYWSEMFNQLYAPDSRVMTCNIRLPYGDFVNLRFNDNLYWDGAYWRIMKIDNYAIGSERLARATLIKVLTKRIGRISTDCDLTVDSINLNGTVSFVDSDGNPADATKQCCTLNGYVWDSRRQVCFARSIAGGFSAGGGGGNNGGGVGVDLSNPKRNRENNIPNPFNDYGGHPVQPFAQKNILGVDIKTTLLAQTTGAVTRSCRQDNNVRDFQIPPNTVMYVRIQCVATETGGTSGTIGNASSQNVQFSVANTADETGKPVVARQVGSTVQIAESKDTGTTPDIDVAVSQAGDGGVASFQVQVTGLANVNLQYFMDVQITATTINHLEDVVYGITYNLDPARLMQGDLSSDDYLFYNL